VDPAKLQGRDRNNLGLQKKTAEIICSLQIVMYLKEKNQCKYLEICHFNNKILLIQYLHQTGLGLLTLMLVWVMGLDINPNKNECRMLCM
jgi:hypothetical protein